MLYQNYSNNNNKMTKINLYLLRYRTECHLLIISQLSTYCRSCITIKASGVTDHTPLTITIHLYPPLSRVVTILESYHASVWTVP